MAEVYAVITPDEKAELRKAADAATAGPWLDWRPEHVKWNDPMACGYDENDRGVFWCTGPEVASSEQARRDALFLVAANPATVLALLDDNARLSAEVERLQTMVSELQHQGESMDYELSAALGMTTSESDGSVANVGTWPEMLAEVTRLRAAMEDRDHPKHTIGTLSWTKEQMRLAGHTCTETTVMPLPPCPACAEPKE
jgi:hypothetical protein